MINETPKASNRGPCSSWYRRSVSNTIVHLRRGQQRGCLSGVRDQHNEPGVTADSFRGRTGNPESTLKNFSHIGVVLGCEIMTRGSIELPSEARRW